jgi:hypothetical protein
MKKLNIISGILVAMLSSTAQAISVGGVELAALLDNVSAANGDFLNYNSVVATDIIDLTQIRSDLTDSDPATYVLSIDPAAYLDMGFTGTNAVYNGLGDDLALFFFGDNDTFSIQINGITNSYSPQTTPIPWTVTDPFATRNLTVALIELDDFGLVNSQAALEEFRVFFGDPSRPALSLVGGYHTQAMSAVPLPLPALLFVSGLGLLGAIGRKRKQG